MSRDDDTDIGGPNGRFPTTLMTALAGAASGDPDARRRSIESVVTAYWKPVYKYVRVKWRRPSEDAKDTCQGFFERATQGGTFAAFDPSKGRFRTFLRHCLDQYVINNLKAEGRLKRGGGAPLLSLDFDGAEAEIDRADLERQEGLEDYFDREWYRGVLSSAIEELRAQCAREGKEEHFAVFERYDLCEDDEPPTYAAIGAELGLPVTTITNRLNYARRELRRLSSAILASVSATDEELASEARLLFGGR